MQKKVLVTGASSGLGEAIALKLAKEGDFVYAGARKTDDIKKLSEKKNTIGVRLDITKPAQIQAAKQKIMAKTPELQNPLDVIVNNAGVAIGGPLVEFNEEKLKHEFDVNVFGAFRITKAFFPLLQKSINEPRIINISSTAGKHALPFFGPYAMSKYALEAYSDSLRRELDPLGIKVVIIEPGKVKTEIWKKAQQQLDNFEHSMFRERALPLVKSSLKKGLEKGQEPNKIAEVVYQAIHTKKPKIRYHLPLNKLRSFALDKFPDSWVDWLVRNA